MSKKYHFIGIGGIGMSAIAHYLLESGAQVSGSDEKESPVIEALRQKGAHITRGHNPNTIEEDMTVVFGTAVKENNVEYMRTLMLNVPLFHRSELLVEIMNEKKALLVGGSHGKTSTSGLLAYLLQEAGLSPSFAVGGIVRNLLKNGGYGVGEYFVAEADESDGSFLNYHPEGLIVTNVEGEHLDYWKSQEALQRGFEKFIGKVRDPEMLFWCADDPFLRELDLPGYGYGFSETANIRGFNFAQRGWQIFLDIAFEDKIYHQVELPLVGIHNASNALAVFGMGIKLGIHEESLRRAFSQFQGLARRSELKGEVDGIAIMDDYAHHPTEIAATLKAIKEGIGSRRLVALFQPHRYSRTRDCMEDFAASFQAADEVIITDIYGAGEKPIEGITSQTLIEKLLLQGLSKVRYIPRDEMVHSVREFVQPNDVLITVGAGDITSVGAQLLEELQR